MLYKLKPLEWVWSGGSVWRMETVVGRYSVHALYGSFYISQPNEPGMENEQPTLDEAKAAAETFYRERMTAGLVPATFQDLYEATEQARAAQ